MEGNGRARELVLVAVRDTVRTGNRAHTSPLLPLLLPLSLLLLLLRSGPHFKELLIIIIIVCSFLPSLFASRVF